MTAMAELRALYCSIIALIIIQCILNVSAFVTPSSNIKKCSPSRLYSTTESAIINESFTAPLDEIEKRRNLAIISHPDSGKTTMTEKLLLYGGALQQVGLLTQVDLSRIDVYLYCSLHIIYFIPLCYLQQAGAVRMKGEQRATQSDFMEMEKQRGISISATVMSFDYNKLHINILDTPGHQDFSEDTYR